MQDPEIKLETAVLRIERMRKFRTAFERRDFRVFQGEQDMTERSVRCCDKMIRHLEDEVVALRKSLMPHDRTENLPLPVVQHVN